MDGFRGQNGPHDMERGTSPTSSASGLSSPPRSSPEASTPSQQDRSHMSITVNPPTLPTNTAEKPPRKKPGRKPKNSADPSAPPDAPKPKRTRKPKDPNAPPKRARKSANSTNLPNLLDHSTAAPAPPRSFAESTATFQIPAPTSTLPSQKMAQSGNIEAQDIHSQRPIQSFFNTAPQPQQPPPPIRTSGQNYDPIRSNYDPVRETIISHNAYTNNSQGSPIQTSMSHRASASPSISSLVDPPNQALTSPSIATQSFFNQQQQQQARFHREDFTPSTTPSTMAESSISRAAMAAPVSSRQPEILPPPPPAATVTKKAIVANPSPKPPKTKDGSMNKDISPAPPPLPGSGIMGGTDGTEFRAPTIILSIPMIGEVNKYVNFSRLAEEQYGWDALHPRLAAQRDRLARVAAAGAALERNDSSKDSGDEMSLDSDAEEGSNVEMGGMSDGRTGTDGGKKVPRKRKMKEDEYDKDDGFVDDTDLLWEEQAAAANDGFFVYSGPLVPEGEKPHLESRAEGPPKRGRGRGSRGGRLSGASRGSAITAAEKLRNGIPLTGPGSRGGLTTRKPRITKADRARMELEKQERELQGTMASMPSNYAGGMSQLASAPQMGTTPMVFNN